MTSWFEEASDTLIFGAVGYPSNFIYALWAEDRTESARQSLAVWFTEICTWMERPSYLLYANDAQMYERVYLYRGIESNLAVE